MKAPTLCGAIDATRGWRWIGALLLVPLLGCTRDYLPGTNVLVTVELEKGDELGEIYRDDLEITVQIVYLSSDPGECGPTYEGETIDFFETELNMETTVPTEPGWVCGYAGSFERAFGVHSDGDPHMDWIDCDDKSAPLHVELDEEADLMMTMDCEIYEDTEVPD